MALATTCTSSTAQTAAHPSSERISSHVSKRLRQWLAEYGVIREGVAHAEAGCGTRFGYDSNVAYANRFSVEVVSGCCCCPARVGYTQRAQGQREPAATDKGKAPSSKVFLCGLVIGILCFDR